MRKSTKRKVWPLHAPTLPLTERHQEQLCLQLHVAVAAINTKEGLSTFSKQIHIANAAMEFDESHNNHSRNIMRTIELMIKDAFPTGKVNKDYCEIVACFIEEWIEQGRITYKGLKQAKQFLKGNKHGASN